MPKQVRQYACFISARGFTLIELLVVVLIIGVLAAVALPQYRFAVEKTRIAEPLLLLRNIKKGYQLCVLQHGTDAEQCTYGLLANLDAQLPGEMIDCLDGPKRCVATKGWLYENDGAAVYANRMDVIDPDIDEFQYALSIGLNPNSDGSIRCAAGSGSITNTWFCPKLCGSNGCEVE